MNILPWNGAWFWPSEIFPQEKEVLVFDVGKARAVHFLFVSASLAKPMAMRTWIRMDSDRKIFTRLKFQAATESSVELFVQDDKLHLSTTTMGFILHRLVESPSWLNDELQQAYQKMDEEEQVSSPS